MAHLSYGLLVFYRDKDRKLYHLVQRRDSYHYISFLTGKSKDIVEAAKYMTLDERQRLLNHSYPSLAEDLFPDGNIPHRDYISGSDLFDSVDIPRLLKDIPSIEEKAQWVIPKGGKKNNYEPPLICALREYKEETLNYDFLKFYDIDPIKNEHIGTDGKLYRVFYFLAEAPRKKETVYTKTECIRDSYVTGETSDVKWLSLEDSKERVPSYLREVFEKAENEISLNPKEISMRNLGQKWSQDELKRKFVR